MYIVRVMIIMIITKILILTITITHLIKGVRPEAEAERINDNKLNYKKNKLNITISL